jgi:cytochrome c5
MKVVCTFAVAACLAASVLMLRGADTVAAQAADPVVRLQQGWDDAHEQTFYHTPQGTVIMPAIWLAALQSPDGMPFMAPEHMQKLGFLSDDRSPANPYGWPIGFAINPAKDVGGAATAGLTCAACHTGEISYHGETARVDGGQAHIDLDAFKKDLSEAILATGAAPAIREPFEQRAVRLGFPANRIGPEFDALYQSVVKATPERERTATEGTVAGPGRNDALAVIARVLFNYALGVPTNTNKATAPVDFPYLWNIWNLNWVQYNGAVRQPMSRNIGEALGVGATTHFIDPGTGSLSPEPERWRASIPVRNLHTLEKLLESLQPPQWPEAVLGPVDRVQAARGAQLFAENCAMCHGIRAIAGSKSEEWSVRVLPLTVIGTDPMQATNFRNDTYDGTKLRLSSHSDAATGLQAVTDAIRMQAYRDAKIPPAQWKTFDGFGRANDITSPCGYKARPLVGVWATAPFLHNGSVPTVFALLSESRPARFQVQAGSTSYDPVHLGLSQEAAPGTATFDTTGVGNSNAGHWFTNDRSRAGRIGRLLTDEEKYDVIAFLKTATYANYPHTVVSHADPEPCVSGGADGQERP